MVPLIKATAFKLQHFRIPQGGDRGGATLLTGSSASATASHFGIDAASVAALRQSVQDGGAPRVLAALRAVDPDGFSPAQRST